MLQNYNIRIKLLMCSFSLRLVLGYLLLYKGYTGIPLSVRPSVCPSVIAKFVSGFYGETFEVVTSHIDY